MYIKIGQSAVIDAIYLAVVHTALHHEQQSERRRTVVLFTDGEDRASYYSEKRLSELLQQTDVQLFIVGIVFQLKTEGITRDAQKKAERLLTRLAQESGGRLFLPTNPSELTQAVTEIIHDLHSQYSITYQSAGNKPEKNFRKIEVKLSAMPGHEGLQTSTRPGYFVKPPRSLLTEEPKKKKTK